VERKLFRLAPADTGISQVRFFNVGIEPQQIGWQRQHPLSELLHEEIVAVRRHDGTFEMSASFEPPITTLALWISADGDDTNSSFAGALERIELETMER
jgi:hypothetical protein